jgi:hypothetical protein
MGARSEPIQLKNFYQYTFLSLKLFLWMTATPGIGLELEEVKIDLYYTLEAY